PPGWRRVEMLVGQRSAIATLPGPNMDFSHRNRVGRLRRPQEHQPSIAAPARSVGRHDTQQAEARAGPRRSRSCLYDASMAVRQSAGIVLFRRAAGLAREPEVLLG